MHTGLKITPTPGALKRELVLIVVLIGVLTSLPVNRYAHMRDCPAPVFAGARGHACVAIPRGRPPAPRAPVLQPVSALPFGAPARAHAHRHRRAITTLYEQTTEPPPHPTRARQLRSSRRAPPAPPRHGPPAALAQRHTRRA